MLGQKPNLDLLKQPLNINYELLNMHKQKSINFLKKNLNKNYFIYNLFNAFIYYFIH